MEQPNKVLEFKKLSNDQYAFVMRTKDIERTEVVSKDFAKSHYEDLKQQRREMVNNMNRMNKEISKSEFNESNEEIEHFLELANKAGAYKKYQDNKDNVDATLKMLTEITTSMDNIEKAMPELLRNKKKS